MYMPWPAEGGGLGEGVGRGRWLSLLILYLYGSLLYVPSGVLYYLPIQCCELTLLYLILPPSPVARCYLNCYQKNNYYPGG